MKKQCLVIGLGTYGMNVAKKTRRLKHRGTSNR